MKEIILSSMILLSMLVYLPVFSADETLDAGKTDSIKKGAEESPWTVISPELKNPAEKKWKLDLGGWYERKWGNTEAEKINGSFGYVYDSGISSFNMSGRGFFEKTGDEETVNNASGEIKLDHYILKRVELFIFTFSEYDAIADLAYRNNSGGGVKFVFLRNRFLKLDLSGAPVYQYEKYENVSRDHDFRASFRYRLRWNPFESLKFDWVVFYVPKADDFSVYRTSSDSSVKFDLKGLPFSRESTIGFRTGYVVKYNSSPAEDTEKMDRTVYAEVSLGF